MNGRRIWAQAWMHRTRLTGRLRPPIARSVRLSYPSWLPALKGLLLTSPPHNLPALGGGLLYSSQLYI